MAGWRGAEPRAQDGASPTLPEVANLREGIVVAGLAHSGVGW